MALINCPECKNRVSSIATSCPQCGTPIAGSIGAGTPLATTQLTAKRLKIQIVFSSLAFWISIVWFFVSCSSGDPTQFISIILFLFSIIWFSITKIRIWWHHK